MAKDSVTLSWFQILKSRAALKRILQVHFRLTLYRRRFLIDGKDYIKHDMSLLLKIPILIFRQPCHLIKTLVEPIIPQNATILDVQCLEWVKEHVEEKMTLLPVLKGWFLLSLDCSEDGMRTIWITLWSDLLEHANATGNLKQPSGFHQNLFLVRNIKSVG